MTAVRTEEVAAADAGVRLDRWLKSRLPGVPHGALVKLIRKGQVRVDGGRAKHNQRLEAGQNVRIPPVSARPDRKPGGRPKPAVSAEDEAMLRSIILYQDDDIIVLNKPPGLPVQGGSGTDRHLDGMLDALAVKGERPRLVHRLDKDTSGVLVLARNVPAARALTGLFRGRETEKLYWGLVKGLPERREGTINLAIEKLTGKSGEKMVPSKDGKTAITHFKLVEQAGHEAAWVAMMPVTGRTHQLRVHMAAIGTPIVGDGKYGGKEAFLAGSISKKLHLHARSITFPHPTKSGKVAVTAPLPKHMADTWKWLDFEEGGGDIPAEDFAP